MKGRFLLAGLSLLLGIAAVVLLTTVVAGQARATAGADGMDTVAVGLLVGRPSVEDSGFLSMAYQGLQRAVSQLGVVGTLYTMTLGSDYGSTLQSCVDDGNDLCIGASFDWADAIWNAASANPDTDFAVVDSAWGAYPRNLRGIVFAEHQVGYLAGTLAGLMTQSSVVGAIGGIDVPPVVRFVEGYRHGAQCAEPNVAVLAQYAGTFDDPDLGAQIAQDMIAQSADVIFAPAGLTSVGAVLTATQSGVWGIGVDEDYYVSVFANGTVAGSDKLLSSAMKRVDNAVFSTIADVVSGTFTSGTFTYDLTNDGVGLAPFHAADPFVPQSARSELEQVKQGIISGAIDVNKPCLAPLKAFLPFVAKE